MAVSRRNFIAAIGGGVALVGGLGAWKVTRMPQSAILPWEIDPEPLADVRLDAFRYAILAPNPHNRQPWLIRLQGDNQATLSIDLGKRLPETDPFDRQLTIGFGTFIAVAKIAAARRGIRVDVEPFPKGEPQPRLDTRPIARLTFSPDATIRPDPLFTQITRRHTNRNVYTSAPTSAQLEALQQDGAATGAQPEFLNKLRPLAVDAITLETTTHRTHMESVRLLRIGHKEIDATPDGLMLTGPMIEGTAMLGMTTRESIADPKSQSYQIGLDQLRESCGSIPAALWITTEGNSRAAQLEAGERYVRTNLRATALGLAMHPLSQALQEYPEMRKNYSAMRELLGLSEDQHLQMLARVGHAEPVPPAGRWPMEKHLLA